MNMHCTNRAGGDELQIQGSPKTGSWAGPVGPESDEDRYRTLKASRPPGCWGGMAVPGLRCRLRIRCLKDGWVGLGRCRPAFGKQRGLTQRQLCVEMRAVPPSWRASVHELSWLRSRRWGMPLPTGSARKADRLLNRNGFAYFVPHILEPTVRAHEQLGNEASDNRRSGQAEAVDSVLVRLGVSTSLWGL